MALFIQPLPESDRALARIDRGSHADEDVEESLSAPMGARVGRVCRAAVDRNTDSHGADRTVFC